MPRGRGKLSDQAEDVLAQVIVHGEWRATSDEFAAVLQLGVAGYVEALGEAALGLRATTLGVKAAVALKIVVQDGTRFVLPEGCALRDQAFSSPVAPSAPRGPLRLVEPKAPDPFAEGMDAAMDGKAPAGPYEPGSAEQQEWDSGYGAGLQAKVMVAPRQP